MEKEGTALATDFVSCKRLHRKFYSILFNSKIINNSLKKWEKEEMQESRPTAPPSWKSTHGMR
jgi:hypothetical protein